MSVKSAPGEVGKRLRHEGRGESALVGQHVHHVTEEDQPVGRGQGVGVFEVLLELPVGILMIVGVVRPAELVHVTRHGREVVVHPGETLRVVTRLVGGIEWVGNSDAPIFETAH